MTTTQAVQPSTSSSRTRATADAAAPSIDKAEHQPGNAFRAGQTGAGVEALQQLMQSAGVNAPSTGKYDAATERAVKSFQSAHGLTNDGLAGMKTIAKLRQVAGTQGGTVVGARTAPTEADRQARPAGTTRAGDMQNADANARSFAPEKGRARSGFSTTDKATRESQAEALLKKQGVSIQPGHTYVVQIDQDPPKTPSSTFMHGYTGQTVVMRGAAGGHLNEVGGPFRTSSHPGQANPVASDHVPGTAFIDAGVYNYTKSTTWHHGKERFNPTSNMPAHRDTNHDGTISGSELNRTYTAGAIQWHQGGVNGPSSTGCQNVDPRQFAAFKAAVEQGGGGTFTYVLARRPNDRTGANAF